MKRPAAHGTPGAATFVASEYTVWKQTYSSKSACYDDLGCGKFCRGHAARAVKSSGKVTFLRCRLRSSKPPCHWSAMIRVASDDSVELLQLDDPKFAEHNSKSVLQGKRGWEDFQERKTVSKLLTDCATSRPQRALRSARLLDVGPVKKVQLKQVQKLKENLVKKVYGCREIGQLREAINKRKALPAARDRGYFCYSSVSTDGKKNKVAMVATTRLLQERWVNQPSCVASMDGGFKFNLLGWPLHVLGHVNEAGQFGLCALGLSSNLEQKTVQSMLEGFRDSTARVTRSNTRKKLAMSDAEAAYRKSLREVFGASNLMCYFHVKQACKDYIVKHGHGSAEQRNEIWDLVSDDIDVLRGAQTLADFQSRCAAIKAQWDAGIVSERTAWLDKGKEERNFPEYFARQWGTQVPDWYIGASNAAIAPSTNNAAEACIKNTRLDAGNVVAGIGEIVAFLLSQVEAVSRNNFDAAAARVTPRPVWRRAAAFSTHIGTQLVRKVEQDGQAWYVCSPREDPSDEDVGARKVLSTVSATALVKAFCAQRQGKCCKTLNPKPQTPNPNP
ncbi:unnamed protein product [Symbiodinium natans]|uniref:MULE transposase domain-containing protein n=1 Tax=Symbiodinium natans TaxID=878477 RepID=A0A812KY83_9DINO|nr:unnamed protein product [Symbiodinium natans]